MRKLFAQLHISRGRRVFDGLPERLELTLKETRVSESGVVAQYYEPRVRVRLGRSLESCEQSAHHAGHRPGSLQRTQ